MSSRSRAILAVAALIVLTIILHGGATGGWWLSDDPQVLLHAMTETPATVLFSPPAWRYLSTSSFTPLVTISFDLDLALAGLSPRFFYLHQIGAIALAAVLLFFLLKDRERTLAAWTGAAIFIASPATVLAARGLMVRHYVEGLVFALIALLLWRAVHRAEDVRFRGLLSSLAAVAYLLAMLAKEFYAPLPLIMIWQARAAGASWRMLMTHLLPSAFSAALYIVWRTWMLGSGGGYGESPEVSEMAMLPVTLWTAMTGRESAFLSAGIAAAGAVALAAAFRHRTRSTAGFLLAAGVFVFLPLAALAASFEPRYAFAGTAVFAAAAALAACARDDRRFLAIPFSLLILLLAAGVNERRAIEHSSRATVAEGRYVWSQPGSAPPILATSPGWYLAGLESIRRIETGAASPAYFLSTDAIVLSDLPADRFVRSVWGTTDVIPLDGPTKQAIAKSRASFVPDAPLEVLLERRRNDIAWKVGPAGGTFSFITVPYYGNFPIGTTGRRRISESRERQFFRIRRDLPNGGWTVSPIFELPPRDGKVMWMRGSSVDSPEAAHFTYSQP